MISISLTLAVLSFWGTAVGEDAVTKIELRSSAFRNSEMIPAEYTCDGADISPSLEWTGVPAGTKSLVLISDDPDAPAGDWVHWVLYDLPPGLTGLAPGIPAADRIPGGGVQGRTDFGKVGYGGPCPPGGIHRYFFKLYALNTVLNLAPGATKKQVEKTMQGHVLASGELMGRYQRT